jgi:membrane protease YdiL (CAAX protease family)
VPLAGYGALVLALPVLRRTAPRFAVGRLAGAPLVAAIALGILTSGVLLAFDALVHPDVPALATCIPAASLEHLILAGLCFSVANAVLEELIFRGLLYEALAAEWGVALAVGASAVLFGLAHIYGYPPGPLGAVLATGYAVALGLLRWWTGGLGLVVACHIGADATIFGILASAGAFDAAA